jgi:hypothetical protein
VGSKKPVLELFLKFTVPSNRFWNAFFNLGFHAEPVPGTLQNLWFLRVPEPVPVPVGPEPFSKFRIPRNWFRDPFYKFRVKQKLFWNSFSNSRFRPKPVPRTLQNLGFLSVPEPVPRTGSGTLVITSFLAIATIFYINTR